MRGIVIFSFSAAAVVRGVAIFVFIAALEGCGNKGPLYLPLPDKPAAAPRIPALPPVVSPDSIPSQRPVPSQSAPAPK